MCSPKKEMLCQQDAQVALGVMSMQPPSTRCGAASSNNLLRQK